jgi:hypothetical protein
VVIEQEPADLDGSEEHDRHQRQDYDELHGGDTAIGAPESRPVPS